MIENILNEFSFLMLWNGGVLFFILLGTVIYIALLPYERDHSIRKTMMFLAGTVILFITLGSPLNVLGRITFSSHIIQLVLLLLVTPPLLIKGFKMKVVHHLLSITMVKKLVHVITHPLVTISLFHLLFYGYHIPTVFDQVRVGYFSNYIYLVALLVAALLLWIPIISKERLTRNQKMRYVVITSLLFIPLSLILLLINESLYSIYTDVDLFITALELCLPELDTIPPDYFEALLPFSPAKEQKTGGGILLVSQLVIFSVLFSYIYKKRKIK
ncbi:cytochrome c oxidase assembly protein [Virgibacillus byunsanensis]|uniref:Cytochrome c oxidase assembly protein n=1 Tax=Virgibacillus byunsanensis TaxID=570945 RepID=A0ABW3LPM7_9BACI